MAVLYNSPWAYMDLISDVVRNIMVIEAIAKNGPGKAAHHAHMRAMQENANNTYIT